MDDSINSPEASTNSTNIPNKCESGKSPSKCKKSLSDSSTNLDKVIEAVSKGILDETIDSKLDSNHIEMKVLKSPKVNGIQSKLNDSKLSSQFEKSPSQPKVKGSKKSKREREKEKDKEKDKDKVKVKEKTKRREKPRKTADPNPSQTEIQGAKEEAIKPDPNQVAKECVDDKKICDIKMDISIVSSNTSEINATKDTQLHLTVNSINDKEASKEHNAIFNGKIEGTTSPAKSLDTDVERKQSRKRRKEKHRNKHGPDAQRSSSKEHKKKRKRKSHDHENPESFPLADGVPKIKIKV